MREPFLSKFKELIRGGAASIDVHDASTATAYASDDQAADDAYVQREVERVAWHQRSLNPLLEAAVPSARRVLDFGCGTGGTTVALALSSLGAEEVIGIDANARAIEAAKIRGRGHDLESPRLTFERVPPGDPLPYGDGSFDLVVTVSCLEFITDAEQRDRAVAELRRIVRPGGFLYITTPRLGLREYHSGRLLGDFRHDDGMPWASSWRQTARWRTGWDLIPVKRPIEQIAERIPWVPRALLERGLAPVIPFAARWQKILLQRPESDRQ